MSRVVVVVWGAVDLVEVVVVVLWCCGGGGGYEVVYFWNQ